MQTMKVLSPAVRKIVVENKIDLSKSRKALEKRAEYLKVI